MTAMRTETHILKFNTNPTDKLRKCFKCNDESNNAIRVTYHCPTACHLSKLAIYVIKIVTGVKLRLDENITLLNVSKNH